MAMNIMKRAAEAGDGTYGIRTEGLRAHRHAELEIVGIGRPAVEAAAKLIDYVIEVVVERRGSKLEANQNVAFPLTIEGHDDIEAVFVGARAVEAEPPGGGFFARVRGTAKGVLRLADLFETKSEVPLTAVATLMLYRANCRVVMGDVAGAIGELRAAIEMMPGDAWAGPMPPLDTDGAKFNWQNHLTYLRLAELLDDERESAAVLAAAYSRFEWLALDVLGATVGELSKLKDNELVEEAKRILQTNLGRPMIIPGPHDGLRFVGSPIWTPSTDGKSVRMASLIPAAFVDYYYGGGLRDPEVANTVAEIAAASVCRFRAEPWRLADMTAGARDLYNCPGSPVAEAATVRHPGHTMLSALIAEASRYLWAGASLDEVRAAFGLAPDGRLSEGLSQKVQVLEAWEGDHHIRAIGVGWE